MDLSINSVSFSFNDTMYRQVNGISMGSPLCPKLDNSFVGFYELLLSYRYPESYIYLRYVDDTFACFSLRNEALLFFHCLNNLYPSLTFTMEEDKDNKLQFLDVLVERCSSAFLTCRYLLSQRSPVCIWVGMLLLLSLKRSTWLSVLQSGL